MPTNVPPIYREAEQQFRAAQSVEEKIEALQYMISVLPKHKGTDKLYADLKRRLSKLQDQQEQTRKSGRRSDPFKVERHGAGQVVLVGAPNAGKSAIIARLTNAHTEVAAYPFTTHAPIPGMMEFEDIQIQLVDTAPVTADFIEPWVPGLVRKADLVLLVLDIGDDDVLDHFEQLVSVFESKRTLLFPPPGAEPQPGTVHKRTHLLANKVDLPDADARLDLLREVAPEGTAIRTVSAETGQGLEELRRQLFLGLNIVRVYTKAPGQKADMTAPFTLPAGSTVIDLARHVHRDIAASLNYARLWGSGVHDGQTVARDHVLADGDICELHA